MKDITNCIVGILGSEELEVVATGFLVAEDLVLTCAHGFDKAKKKRGPGDAVQLQFWAEGANRPERKGRILQQGWDLVNDTAVIAFDGGRPAEAEVVEVRDAWAQLPASSRPMD